MGAKESTKALLPNADANAKGAKVLDPSEVQAILALKKQGWGSKRIARELGINRGTVKRYFHLGGYRAYSRKSLSKLEPHKSWLKQRFLEVAGNVRVLHRELIDRNVDLSYVTLARYMQPYREELDIKAKATLRFETAPGYQMQVDFGQQHIELAGSLTKVHFAVMTLGYSRRCFVRAFLAERQEHWLAAIESAFNHFGGVPMELLVDNAAALVRDRNKLTGQVYFTDAFHSFCEQHGIRPRACQPFRARSKGKVESGVKYVKRNALAGRLFNSFEHLESYLNQWIREVADVRIHGTTHERPIDRFSIELKTLQPLRVITTLRLALKRKVANDCLIDVDTNRYSVPHRYVGRTVSVLVADGQLAISCDGIEIARHLEAKGRYKVIVQEEHTKGLWPRLKVLDLPVMEVEAPILNKYEALLGGIR